MHVVTVVSERWLVITAVNGAFTLVVNQQQPVVVDETQKQGEHMGAVAEQETAAGAAAERQVPAPAKMQRPSSAHPTSRAQALAAAQQRQQVLAPCSLRLAQAACSLLISPCGFVRAQLPPCTNPQLALAGPAGPAAICWAPPPWQCR